ncbi:MAG: DUF799 family lipoprotein [Campylobacteraceae bacterium]|nr:DUF799 family lipoprotein [Campylobacteraceae bacterium]
MRKLNYISIVVAITFLFTGCGVVSQSLVSKGQLYPKLYKQHPKTILVLPAKNTTTSVDATDHFRYTITKPLAEKGYYVFPVHLVDSFFKSENLTNSEQIRQIPVKKLKEIFNADAILYVDINAWDTSYAVVSSSVDVGLSFSLVDANSGEEIWNNYAYAYSYAGPGSNSGLFGLLVSAIAAAINTSVDYTELANVSNIAGVGIMPSGEYNKNYKKDFNDKLLFTNNTNLKDGKLYVNEYFIKGNNKEEKVALTVKGRNQGYHSFPVTNINSFNHNGYSNYYLTRNINDKKYLRNRFFRYENNRPYLLSNGKKVFVYTESDGTIPFSEESGDYYFNIDRVVELIKLDS